ncbi:M28 family metallopeptidase [Novosphingobium sp.]|uniref:M28 family metallopeptidase n=1 Tax=Novosphingobium sp. TaxID=1874826 RepID=UPI003341490F
MTATTRIVLSAALAMLGASALALLGAPALRAEEPPFPASAVQADVTFLADDLLLGREPGTPGFDIAARFVATRFQALGLKPAGPDGSWYQPVVMREARRGAASAVKLTYGGAAMPIAADQALLRASLTDRALMIEAPLVFAGYGLDRADLGFDDYRGIDVRGKIVVVLSGFPKGTDSELGAFLGSEKAVMAMKRGAVAVITVQTLQDRKRMPWERLIESAGRPSRGWVGSDGQAFVRAGGIKASVTLHPDVATALFAASGHPLDGVLAAADQAGGRPRGFELKAAAQIVSINEWRDIHTENVVALLPGSDPALARETVVLSAHLDHLGAGGKGADAIYNGAMDNAAGVATMLASARALAASPSHPRRSVLFAALTGEESGLLGSDYLARHPLPAAGTMIADVNFDMPILLYRFSDVVAFGAQHSSMGPIVAAAAKRDGIALSPDPIPEEGIFTRSDHFRFVQQGIPSVFMVPGFTGEGEKQFRAFLKDHYHQPGDDLSLPFDWQAGALFARVNTHIVEGLANADQAPRWYQGDFFGHEYAAAAPTAPKP